MVNLVTRADSDPVDFAIKNNTYAEMSAGLKALDFGIETDTGLLACKDHTGAYKRSAPRSTMTAAYIPKCKSATTGELENSIAAETANEFVINGAEADKNFRVGTLGASYGIYHDAGLNRTGLGEGTPPYRLSITDANPVISIKDSDTNAIALINAANSTGSLAIDADAFNTVANSTLSLRVDGADALTIIANGNVEIGTNLIVNGKTYASQGFNSNFTAGTGWDHYNWWYPIVKISIPSQFGYASAKIILSTQGGGSDSTEYGSAIIYIRAKHQDAMSEPFQYLNLIAEQCGGNIASDDLVFVLTSDTDDLKEGTLYVRNPVSYSSIGYTVLNTAGNIEVYSGEEGVSVLPTGTQYASTAVIYNDSVGNVGIGTNSDLSGRLNIKPEIPTDPYVDTRPSLLMFHADRMDNGLTLFPTGCVGSISTHYISYGVNSEMCGGGLTINGIGNINSCCSGIPEPGLTFNAYCAIEDPADSYPIMKFNVARRSGTDLANLGNDEIAYQFFNNEDSVDRDSLLSINGDGKIGIHSPSSVTNLITIKAIDDNTDFIRMTNDTNYWTIGINGGSNAYFNLKYNNNTRFSVDGGTGAIINYLSLGWILKGVTTATVGLDTTKYITVNIDGIDYKLALAT